MKLNDITDRQLSIQLFTMGCIPGETLKVERIAPFGDPLLLKIEDSFISVRRSDAELMLIEKI